METTKELAKPAAFVAVRGESGRLYGYLDPRTGVLHVRKGHTLDRVDLGAYLKATRGERPT